MSVAPRPNPETVAVLLDTTWRVAEAEATRTETLDRKASTLASFAALLTSLTAALGSQVEDAWAAAFFSAGLAALVASVGFAVATLLPREYVTLGIPYLRGFPTWSEILKPPEQVRGDTMRTLVDAVIRERAANDRKAQSVQRAFVLLVLGLTILTAEAATLAWTEAF